MASQSQKPKTLLDKDSLLTRTELAEILHCGLSSLDTLDTYAEIPRVKIGRHTFFLKSDVTDFVMSHRTGGVK